VIATVKLSIPVPSSMLVVNLLGILGLAGMCVSVGALTGNWWWSALLGSAVFIGLSLVGAAHQAVRQVDGEHRAKPVAVARAA
jgi:hypothetical protein